MRRPIRRTARRAFLALTALVLPVAVEADPAAAAVTFTVDGTGDGADGNPGDGLCDTAASGRRCTLRAAIQEANATAGADTIAFGIGSDGGLKTITPATQLPVITDTVTINGYTQPGASPNTLATGDDAVLRIQLRGTNAGEAAVGLRLAADDSVIKGLVINRFGGEGILVTGSGNQVAGSFIGTGAGGATDLGNGSLGVLVDGGTGNTIGGTSRAARNVLSGNEQAGAGISGQDAVDNAVKGNLIGTDAAGTAALGNLVGVLVGAPDALIGGGAGSRNVISGNVLDGVRIGGDPGTVVRRNFIGTDATGTAALPNDDGISLTVADDTVIGGTTSGARNVISGNAGHGLFVQASDRLVVQGNYIGTDVTGAAALGNDERGMLIVDSDDAVIGGATEGAGNVVSANGAGMALNTCAGCVVQGNRIGTKADGSGNLGNAQVGVSVSGASSDVLVGGAGAAGNGIVGSATFGVSLLAPATGLTVQGNAIISSGADGVFVSADDSTVAGNAIIGSARDGVHVSPNGQGNRILSNQILGTDDLAINLEGGTEDAFGVTANDTDDPDTGANDLQNFPVITSAIRSNSTGITTIAGSLNSTPNTEFTIHLFLAAPDDSGHGGTLAVLDQKTRTTNADGDVGFSFASTLPPGQVVTVTATNTATNETSELSANVTIVPGP